MIDWYTIIVSLCSRQLMDTSPVSCRIQKGSRSPRWLASLVCNNRLSPLWTRVPQMAMLRTCPNMTLAVEQDVKPQFRLSICCRIQTQTFDFLNGKLSISLNMSLSSSLPKHLFRLSYYLVCAFNRFYGCFVYSKMLLKYNTSPAVFCDESMCLQTNNIKTYQELK